MTIEEEKICGNVEYRSIPGFDGYYEAGDDGTIKSLCRTVFAGNRNYYVREKILKGSNQNGKRVMIQFKGTKVTVRVSRLVWEVFIGQIPDGMFVLHKNGNELDCRLVNLCLGDQAKAERMKAERNVKMSIDRVTDTYWSTSGRLDRVCYVS